MSNTNCTKDYGVIGMIRWLSLLVALVLLAATPSLGVAQEVTKQYKSEYTGLSLTYPSNWELTAEGSYVYLEKPDQDTYIRIISYGQDAFMVPRAVALQFSSDLAMYTEEEMWFEQVAGPTEVNSKLVPYGPQTYSEYRLMHGGQPEGRLYQWAFRTVNNTFSIEVYHRLSDDAALAEAQFILCTLQVDTPKPAQQLTAYNKGMTYPLAGWQLYSNNEESTIYWHATGSLLTVSCLDIEAETGGQQVFLRAQELLLSLSDDAEVQVLGELPGYMGRRNAKAMHYRLNYLEGDQYLGQQYYLVQGQKLYLFDFNYRADLEDDKLLQQAITDYLAEVVIL